MQINPSRIERYFEKYEFNTPYLLCSSDCESFAVKDLLRLENGAEERFVDLHLGYTETRGNPELREAISTLYEICKEDHVMVFTGAEEGVFCALHAILHEGDHYIVQHPNYQSLQEIPTSIGCEISQWELSHSDSWSFHLDKLERLIKPNTRAICINNPHNPTGAIMSGDELNELISIASKHDLYIFSDEVYRFSEYDQADRLPAVCDLYEKGASLGVMSKSFGLPGLRIGWITTRDNNLFKSIAQIKDFITICNSAPSEFLATIALRNIDVLMKRNMRIIRKNLKLLDEFFKQHNQQVRWVRPKAGPITLVEIIPKIDMTAFSEHLRKEQGVLILPGSIFDYSDQHFRLGFGRDNLPAALKKFEGFLIKSFA